jgi:hypothetical protein
MSEHDLVTAIEQLKNDPEQLTSAQIALIAKADPALAARARHSQRDAVMASAIVTFMKAALEPLRVRLAELEAADRRKSEQLNTLVELTADRAATVPDV